MEKLIAGEDVLLIKKTNLVRPYKDDAKEGFKGKNYRIYAFGKDAFTVHEDDDFHQDFIKGNIAKVFLDVDDNGASLLNYIPWERLRAQRMHQVSYDAITVENFRVAPISNPEELIA